MDRDRPLRSMGVHIKFNGIGFRIFPLNELKSFGEVPAFHSAFSSGQVFNVCFKKDCKLVTFLPASTVLYCLVQIGKC